MAFPAFAARAGKNREAIGRDDLRKMRRHHVHLFADIPTAKGVGARHGKPLVFAVKMSRDGAQFYCSDNGVWLVEKVWPKYLQEKV